MLHSDQFIKHRSIRVKFLRMKGNQIPQQSVLILLKIIFTQSFGNQLPRTITMPSKCDRIITIKKHVASYFFNKIGKRRNLNRGL